MFEFLIRLLEIAVNAAFSAVVAFLRDTLVAA